MGAIINPGIRIIPTYRAATTTTFAAAAGSAMFFVITGSPSKVIIVQRIRYGGITLTAVEYDAVVCEKWSTAPTGGTATALTQVSLDSGVNAGAAGTATLCQVYTVAPTEGSLVGTIATLRLLSQATTAAAAGLLIPGEFDFRGIGGTTGVYLRGAAEALSLAFGAAPATSPSLTLDVEWVEI